MGIIKKTMLFGLGIPVRPLTHTQRRQKKALGQAKRQTQALEAIARQPTPRAAAPPQTPAPPTPPGWYRDPLGWATWRWWDGEAWTDHTG